MTSSVAVALACLLTAQVVLTATAGPEDAEATLKIVYSDHPHPASSLPQVIHYRVTLDGNASVVLRLHRRSLQLETVPVFARHQNQITRVDLGNATQDVVGFYQGDDTVTAVALKVRAETNATSHEMSGAVHFSNSLMSILPANATLHAARHNSVHVLRKLKSVQADYRHEMPPNGSHADQVYRKAMHFAESRKQSGSLGPVRRSRQIQPRHDVGILLVVDYSAYKRIELGLKLNNPVPTVDDVLKEVRFYCAQAENMVDVLYRTINANIVSIGTTLKAIYVETTKSGNYWLDKWTVPGKDPQRLSIDASTALLNFTSMVSSTLHNLSLPTYDHASLFTGYDLSSPYNQTAVSYDTVGIAWLATTCTGNGTSVIEMTGALAEGRTLAHELGHSLGAHHDGDGNYCRATDQYIMTAISQSTSGIQSTNSFRFSSCSQFAMADYIEALNSYGINCLLNDEKPYNETEWKHEISVIPGQRYSASEQCKQAFGPTYTVCGGAILGSNVCEKLWCYDITAQHLGCTASKAIDGTPCGNNKWCVRGACVYNSTAPAGSDTCPLGDVGEEVHVFSDASYTCSNMPSFYCYNKDVYDVCCKTCGDRYNSAQPHCPYGNKANCSGLTPLSCQDSQIRIRCCGLCSEYVMDIPGCPHGDYYTDCRDYVPRVCSLIPQECCETCAARQRTTTSATTWSAVVPAKTTYTFATTTNTASTVESSKTTMSISALASAVFISRKF